MDRFFFNVKSCQFQTYPKKGQKFGVAIFVCNAVVCDFVLFCFSSHEHIEILSVNQEILFFRQREGDYLPSLRLLHKCKWCLILNHILTETCAVHLQICLIFYCIGKYMNTLNYLFNNTLNVGFLGDAISLLHVAGFQGSCLGNIQRRRKLRSHKPWL